MPVHPSSPPAPSVPTPDQMEILAVAARAGDRGAFEGLVDLARPRLLRMALAFGAPPDDAPDLVQEVLLVAWRHVADFDEEKGTFLAWLARGLHGRVANLRRGAGRRDHFLERAKAELATGASRDREPQGAVEARVTLAKLLAFLTPRQREVVALYELGGLSGRETAAVLGIGEAAVRSIARDARQQLRTAARKFDDGRLAS